MNPNAKVEQDQRTPADLLDIIEAKQKEIAGVIAALRSQNCRGRHTPRNAGPIPRRGRGSGCKRTGRHRWILNVREEESEIRRGVHYWRLESDLSQAKTDQVLAVLHRPEILDPLEKMPLSSISILRLRDPRISAFYTYEERSIALNSGRKRGVHFGGEFQPGSSRNMSWATTDGIESIRRALLHEVAHHFEAFDEAASLMEAGFASPGKRPITRYAGTGWREYFAESFVAHFVEPDALSRHDPNGSMMVRKVLAATRK